jgi:hypothetical protein
MPRIRVCLSSGEFEVEGDEQFIDRYKATVGVMLEHLASGNARGPKQPELNSSERDSQSPESFGQILHRLPKSATGTDQVLLAGQYAQTSSADNTFATAEANRLLVEQGIKLANPSQSLKNNLTAKRVFKVGKRYRVAKDGEEHLASLTKH